jgi:two-component system sensor histidine kinase BaeS
MIKRLWVKFLILLLAVSLIALSAALLLRELMVRDFREFLEGEQEDRVYWVTSDLEGSYETFGKWQMDTVRRDAVWALMLGFETRLVDKSDTLIMDTERALNSLSPLVRRRVLEMTALRLRGKPGASVPYPLFLRGKEIGTLELRFLAPKREHIFIERSNFFLLRALGVLGGLAVVLSFVFSNRLTLPLKKIASAAAAISEGNLSKRVDVTTHDELGRLSETFNRMAHTLEAQESLRKKLISNMAHELRTPLTAIQGELEGMMDGLIPTGREQLLSLHEEASRLKKMLEGIEELTRAQASALLLKKRRIEIRPFLENMVERMGRPVKNKGIAITLECEEGLTANADPDCLSEVVINLVGNAIKAVEGGGTITVVAAQKKADFVFVVRDTGIGIKEEDLPFIFERFYKTGSGGLGLGLAIVRELVGAHGGTIDVQSTYGAGTVFTVRLPG